MNAPYTDSILTDKQAEQNQLLARFMNYRTGFSATVADYLSAYRDCHDSNPPTGSALCIFSKPLNDPSGFFEADTTPCSGVQTQAAFIAQQLYQVRRDSLIANFDSLYKSKCLEARYREEFYVKYQPKEYHYTLYFYDQAGNLVKTMPPAAVIPNFSQSFLDSVVAKRDAGAYYDNYKNNDLLATYYGYNSLNKVVLQNTPDAGKSTFWYDRLGRLAVSRNAKQILTGKYSYTLYDPIGRIIEVGQAAQATDMTQTISQDTTLLKDWLAASTKEQITGTVYDVAYSPLETILDGNTALFQKNLRNRVSYTYVKEAASTEPWDAATFYSYDIPCNVDTLLQDYQTGAMASAGNRFKKVVYNYDLISGKVNSVAYQPGWADEFYHRYVYDADNRLTEVYTSKDKIFWERDAAYDYYRHGPLARTILGQQQVQGVDYAYTIQGWLKGVNSTAVGDGSHDMGQDGKTTGANSNIARDAYGFSLNYFTNDYTPIGNTNPFAGITIANNLFNGNIKAMMVNIPKLGEALTYGYQYDQLNRLTAMDAWKGLNNATNVFTATGINDYKERISYDPNGNIKTYLRNGTGATLNLNNYSYAYTINTNRLASVYNSVNTATKDYAYDAIGNTTSDGMQGVTNGVWNVYGKLQSLTNMDGQSVTYTYSADGQRITKKVGTVEEWYVRDATGNIMATYKIDAAVNGGDLTLSGFYKYGSSLLGVKDARINVKNIVAGGNILFERGSDNYLLSDANGNTKATVSDKKLQYSTNGTTVDYYLADVRTATLHSSFGANAKTYNGGFAQANFNGQRKSVEIGAHSQTALFWEYNGDVGRRWNVDPRPTTGLSLYSAYANNPIWITDILGDTIDVKGDNNFVLNSQRNLLKIEQTEIGKAVIERLQKSTTTYTITEAWFLKTSNYDPNTGKIKYDDNPWMPRLDGGAINGLITLSHELYHAYSDDVIPGGVTKISRQDAEIMAVQFQNYITSVYGLGNMRTGYSGLPIDFPSDESAYNPQNEKIKNFSISPNHIKNIWKTNDGNTGVNKVIQQPISFTISFEKSFDQNGKEIKQSVKKTSVNKIAKENHE